MAFKSIDSKPDFPKLEEEVLKFWEDNQIFEKSLEQTKERDQFVFFEGPPTANGKPGIHHVEARAFKDLIPRFQTMQGKFVLRKGGWDTHGLPVELEVEKKLGISGKKQIESIKSSVRDSIIEFNKLCKESVWQYKEDWEKLTHRMGFWIDLKNPYVTYDNSYIESVWWIVKQIWDKGLIYLGHKVVPYCPRCGTALSSHEVAQGYQTVTDNSVYVKFKLKSEPNTYILSWTTTPWTLPGNLALAVGENIDYIKAKVNDEYLILAKEQLALLGEAKDSVKDYELIKGKDLVGLEYEPLFDIHSLKSDKSYKVYAADFVTTTDGTGIVHTAVMYGEDDYQLGEKIGLPKFHTVDEAGKFISEVSGLAEMFVKDVKTEKKIFELLGERVLKIEKYKHEYPHCWRCNTPLLYYARDSWFIAMSKLREQLKANNEQINWVPEYIKHGRFGEWLDGVKDWAISRERYWGTPLPIWQCTEGHTTVVGSVKELGTEIEDLHRPFIDDVVLKCKECKGDMKRVPGVMDVWFDSGAMPYAQWHYPFENKEKIDSGKQFPADYISEAIDQTRGWFYTLLAVSTLLDRGTPYKNVINLGFLLDSKGQKMSKSKGNVIDPWNVINKYGVDAARWYMYSVNQPGDDKLLGERDLELVLRKNFVILWNVLSFFITYANHDEWDSTKESNEIDALDYWILVRLQEVVNKVTESLEKYDVFRAVRTIEEFINELSTWYVRRSRDRKGAAVYQTLYKVLKTLALLLAPFTPFISESIWQVLKTKVDKESVHLASWPETKKLDNDQEIILLQMSQVKTLVELGLRERKDNNIKIRQPLSKLEYSTKGKTELSDGLIKIILDELNIKSAKFMGEDTYSVKLDTNITLDLKKEGLARELERSVQELRKKSGLKVGEVVNLTYDTNDGELIDAFSLFDTKKTYIKGIQKGSGGEEVQIDGKKLTIALGK